MARLCLYNDLLIIHNNKNRLNTEIWYHCRLNFDPLRDKYQVRSDMHSLSNLFVKTRIEREYLKGAVDGRLHQTVPFINRL
jgi:hypothetical protein